MCQHGRVLAGVSNVQGASTEAQGARVSECVCVCASVSVRMCMRAGK